MSHPVWTTVICPLCECRVHVALMSLAATCRCGAYYVEPEVDRRGWYRSREAYNRGEAAIA